MIRCNIRNDFADLNKKKFELSSTSSFVEKKTDLPMIRKKIITVDQLQYFCTARNVLLLQLVEIPFVLDVSFAPDFNCQSQL